MKPLTKYCAIYTRKSTEEGLEQEFNTLDAQREACLAYIASQKSEGWTALKDHYDDGGYSGGNIERPALQNLIADIKAGKVHTVVVYKIDRLTRSLMDFSKLVEVFDQYGVTFVSVTQSFNTTTSMGRLTLNVLLSFAQFEREVIGERVRDKVAASKKKGMWMGGNPPLGYNLDNKKLSINQGEAKTVQYIFKRYLELGSVAHLKQDLEIKGIKSKSRVSTKGKQITGTDFSKGALYHLLRNPIFAGHTKHKDKIYEGMHDRIIPQDVWESVQLRLSDQSAQPRGSTKKESEGNLLKGKLFDIEGNYYSPSHANKNGRRYNYYVSQALLQYRHHPKGVLARLPSFDIEKTVEEGIRANALSVLNLDFERDQQLIEHIIENQRALTADNLMRSIKKVIVDQNELKIYIDTVVLIKELEDKLKIQITSNCEKMENITIPFCVKRIQNGAVVIQAKKESVQHRDSLDLPSEELNKLIQGIIWRDEHFSGLSISQIANRDGVSDTFVGKLIHNSIEFI